MLLILPSYNLFGLLWEGLYFLWKLAGAEFMHIKPVRVQK
ncbi:hypothetical protein wVul_1871 [Wolbachia endosymbiont of Armadillidium vulgare str. wVulC]|nr:hypothetical protein wVul_1871 [Wolbachia endosymbiont of Armadillidium vulgare str. wVulC]